MCGALIISRATVTRKILFTWSGGKDSALALYELQRHPDDEVVGLLTTVTEDYDRVSMHGVRRILLERQAESLNLPLEIIPISKNSSPEEYASRMKDILMHYQSQGVSSVAFGDVFLEDVRNYREENLSQIDMTAIFPIWKRDTTKLAHSFIDWGFKALITCVDSEVLDKGFVGRMYDESFLSDLPAHIDPCGEKGEFHSFVYDGPLFPQEISCQKGEIVFRENRFYFCDLIPV